MTTPRRHLLVTNDFPPKLGGIQTYLHELWSRLPADSFAVLTTPHAGAEAFDAAQPFPIERTREPLLLPHPGLVGRVNRLCRRYDAGLVLLDPALPVGLIGPHLERPYGVVLHGAEVTIPGRLPGLRRLLARVLDRAELVVAAGNYPLAEGERCLGRALPAVVVPPGVDADRFRPFTEQQRAEARADLGIGADTFVVATVNRLVARKGMDVLIDATKLLVDRGHDVLTLIGGTGRCHDDLLAQVDRTGSPVRILGRIDEATKARLYGAADAMAMLCHDRWMGLEQEGFGIVFLEAAAAAVPQVAGRSGGAHEAVEDGVTGIIVDEPRRPAEVARALETLLTDRLTLHRMGEAARKRAIAEFDQRALADSLGAAINRTLGVVPDGSPNDDLGSGRIDPTPA
ncbi:MAG: glycosyltransferase family 4 protein [Acidimicrobiales bacterium]